MKFPYSRHIQIGMSLLSSAMYLVRQSINLYRVCCPNEQSEVDDVIETAMTETKAVTDNLKPVIDQVVRDTADDQYLSYTEKKKILERLLALKFNSISKIQENLDE